VNASEFVGNAVIVFGSAALAAAMIAIAAETLRRLFERRAHLERNAVRNEIGRGLVVDSHWFSEDAATQELVAEYGRLFRDNGAADVQQVREVWRRARKRKS